MNEKNTKNKDILLKIIGSQPSIEGGLEETELITEGRFYEKNGSFYIVYDESEISGMEGYRTSLKISGDAVKMNRYGIDESNEITSFEFEKGKRFKSTYQTPFGPIDVELLTNDIVNNITKDGAGTLNVDYHISLHGITDTRNMLNVEIMKRQN